MAFLSFSSSRIPMKVYRKDLCRDCEAPHWLNRDLCLAPHNTIVAGAHYYRHFCPLEGSVSFPLLEG